MPVADVVRKNSHARLVLQHFINRTAKALFHRIKQSRHSPRHHEITSQISPGPKLYAQPAARKLTIEQARLIVLGHSTLRDPGALDLMPLLFPEDSMAT